MSPVPVVLPDRRWRALVWAAPTLAASSLVAAVLEAVVLDFAIVSPADLVADVARLQVPWIVAQVLLIGGQELLLVVALALAAVLGRDGNRPVLALAQLGLAGGMFVLSGVFHGVFGWHVAALDTLVGPERASAAHLAEIVHALGDTTYYLGIAATALAVLGLGPAIRRSDVLPDRLATLGVVAAVAQLAEFGYFLLPGLAWVAPVGVLLQAGWYVELGRAARRVPSVAAATWARPTGTGPTG